MRQCATCGTEISSFAPEGLCPECLLRDGFNASDEPTVAVAPEAHRGRAAAPSPTEASARFFGDYELLEKIAQGGMGIVYKARQLKLDRIVALKTLLLGIQASLESVKRFQVEVVAAASLRHPNIVAIHEVGFREGQHFFTMDFVNGPTLAALAQGKPLPAKRAARYLQAIAQAIHYAHERGILHRDLKPSNVLIDETDQPRVTDFGLAKRLEGDSGLTLSGQVLGTPNYLPPEQAGGRRQHVGRASDVYALGAILYYLLAGRPPFVGETLETTLDQVLHQEPVSPRLLNGSVPRDLETICLKCLEKEPSRRYATAQALADELERFVRGEPILARPIGPTGKVWRWCRRKPLVAGLSAGLLLALVLGFVGVTWQWRQTERERQLQRRYAYVASMRAAHQALQLNDRGTVTSLLQQHRPKPGDKEDLRGIEWRYLWQESRGDEVRSFPHPSGLKDAALSPDGRYLVTLAFDDRIRIWDASTALQVKELPGQSFPSPRKSLAFSSDGSQLVVPGPAGIEILETSGWTRRLLLEGASAPLCLSSDGRRLGAVNRTNLMVQVWDLPTLTCAVLTNTAVRYHNLALSSDGTQIAFSSANPFWGWFGQVKIWNAESKRTEIVQENSDSVCLAISPDDHWLASGHFSGEVCCWRLADRQLVARFKAHSGSIYALAFSPDSRILASGGTDQLICLWESGTTNRLESWADLGTPMGLAFSQDGQKLATASYNRTAKLWDLNRRRDAGHTFRIPDGLVTIGSLPDGSALVTSDTAGRIHCLWHLPDGLLIRSNVWDAPALHGCPGVKCFPANRLAVGVDTNGTVHLWDLTTQMHLRLVPLGGTGFEPAYLSSDSQWLLGYRPDDSGVLCDLRVGQTVPHFPRLRYYSYPAAFSPDGRRLAYSATNYTIKLWDLTARRETITLGRHDLPVTVLCFSPDGRVLASGGVDGEFKLWSVDTGRLLFPTPKTHQSIVHQLAFSSDGETVVSCDTDLTTHWWNMTTGQEMLLLRENAMAGGNEYLAMESYYGAHTDLNPGAKWLVWQGRRGLIRVTPLPTLAEIDVIDRSQRAAP